MEHLDSIDLVILKLLQNNARVSLKEIAGELSLSSPSVSTRIKRMERDNIILGYHADINTEHEIPLVKALIHMKTSSATLEDIKALLLSTSEVNNYSFAIGPYNLVIKVIYSSMSELYTFVNQLNQYGETMVEVLVQGE